MPRTRTKGANEGCLAACRLEAQIPPITGGALLVCVRLGSWGIEQVAERGVQGCCVSKNAVGRRKGGARNEMPLASPGAPPQMWAAAGGVGGAGGHACACGCEEERHECVCVCVWVGCACRMREEGGERRGEGAPAQATCA